MLELVMSILTSGFTFVFTMLKTINIDGVSLWTFIIAFGLGAGLIRALMSLFNPAASGSIAAGWSAKAERAEYKNKK